MPADSNSQDVRENYAAGPTLGRGAYGVVVGCVHLTSKIRYACKSVDFRTLLKTSDGINVARRLRNEIGIMGSLAGHPNIVGLRDVYECEASGYIFLVQELCDGGTLGDVMRAAQAPLDEERAAGLFRGIVKSVLHCHQVGWRAHELKSIKDVC